MAIIRHQSHVWNSGSPDDDLLFVRKFGQNLEVGSLFPAAFSSILDWRRRPLASQIFLSCVLDDMKPVIKLDPAESLSINIQAVARD